MFSDDLKSKISKAKLYLEETFLSPEAQNPNNF